MALEAPTSHKTVELLFSFLGNSDKIHKFYEIWFNPDFCLENSTSYGFLGFIDIIPHSLIISVHHERSLHERFSFV